MIEFPAGDHAVAGYLALPAAGEGPGVLVLHAWWGLNDFFKEVCDRLAQAGFVAFAPDLYHGNIATTVEEAQQIRKEMENAQSAAQTSAEASSAVTYLRQHPAARGQGIACVGFSLGAMYAYDLSCAHPSDVAAVVAFYGAGDAEADYSAARAVYLGQYVEHDEWEEDEYVDQLEAALRAAGREVTFYRYPGLKHWFMETTRPNEYNAEAANLAWQRMIDFLHGALTA
jgi:carboxymethylenebutenolidase